MTADSALNANANPLPHTDQSAILEQEIGALQAVLTTLGAEHSALEARDAEALTAASESKLQRIDAARLIGLGRAALLPNGVGAEHGPVMSARWDQLVDLARMCKEKNERNGMLISWQRRYIEQTLAVLRNEGNDAKTYGPNGENHRRGGRRGTLGSA